MQICNYAIMQSLRAAPNFQGGAHQVRRECAVVPGAHVELGVGWLGTNL